MNEAFATFAEAQGAEALLTQHDDETSGLVGVLVKGADHGFDVLVRSGRTHTEVIDELATTIAAWMTAHAR